MDAEERLEALMLEEKVDFTAVLDLRHDINMRNKGIAEYEAIREDYFTDEPKTKKKS